MNNIRVSSITTPIRGEEIFSRWNLLLEKSRSESCFLTLEWLMAWSECFLSENRKPRILLLHEKEELIAAAPLYLTHSKCKAFAYREIRFLGSPETGSDYLDVIIRKGREKSVAEAIYDYLITENHFRWDVLSLGDIPADSLFLQFFINRVKKEGKYFAAAPGAYCPIVTRTLDYDAYFNDLSKWRKKKFKQDARVLERDHTMLHSTIEGEQIWDSLPGFFEFYSNKSGYPGNDVKRIMGSYVARWPKQRETPVQIDFLTVDGSRVAGLLHLKHKTTLSMYLMAVDKKFNPKISLGNLLVGLCIKNAIENGYSVYDFLKGDEDYKFHWANGGKRTLTLEFWNATPIGRALAFSSIIKNSGKVFLR